MTKQYRDKKWHDFRREVIDFDGNECTQCGKKASEGAILQVHHKQYIPGRKPWEYGFADCETLCKGCHAAEHGIIRPETGWTYISSSDLGETIGSCDRCGTSIRYVYLIHHPTWEPIEVGTDCCDDLTGTEIASEERKKSNRLQNFLRTEKWEADANVEKSTIRKIPICVIKTAIGFRLEIAGKLGKNTYQSAIEAKIFLFELNENGQIRKINESIKKKSKNNT
ncbi:HNH endonuclease [Vogesella facilis]|uniref:HNH endonuclease n=1 Tax=Vogesella facilis TaxID=1655232 RepID=A0ABV7RCC4_9NEIS